MQMTEVSSKGARGFRELNGDADSRTKSAAGKDRASCKPSKITLAEQRVLGLVAQARTNKEIASNLGISPATVKRHMEKILLKLGLRNRVEAAIYGLILNGCPHASSSGCVFRKLQAGVGEAPFHGPIDL